MVTRRQFVTVVGATAVGAPLAIWLAGPSGAASGASDASFPVSHSDAEWRAALTSAQYKVLRGHSTERAFSSPLNHEKRHGTFSCAGCGQAVFSSETKFESGTGWPSFWDPLDDAVGTSVDSSYFMVRTEVHCVRCGSHLGHVFSDGPPPSGLRYCMNGVALTFTPSA